MPRRIPGLNSALAVLVCAGLALGLPLAADGRTASASTLPGADHPALVAAVEQWLADDEEPALRAMAALAQDGNTAARTLLAVIDKTPAMQGPWLAYLPRDERIAILRAPGGLSGQSWLHDAGAGELARNWLALMSVLADPAVIEEFNRLGEARAAREALVVLAAREHPALRDLPAEATHPELLYLLWRGADEPRREALLARLPAAHPQRALMGEPQDDATFLAWLETSPVAEPLRALCQATCGDSMPTCLSAAYGALASHNALVTLGSPIEALIPQTVFLDSARGRGTVMRRILQSTDARGRRAMLSGLRAQNECLAEALNAENARYRYRRPGTEEPGPEAAPAD